MSAKIEEWEIPYDNEISAFFALVRRKKAAHDGANCKGGPQFQRPGNGLDVQIIIDRLYRSRRITDEHLKVLNKYGLQELPPDPTRPSEEKDVILWDNAMALLRSELKHKGLIYG